MRWEALGLISTDPGSEMCSFSSKFFCPVLLGGEFLYGLNTRWKLSWRYELAGSFPVKRPGVNQGPSQRERLLLPCLLLLFFFTTPLLLHPLIEQRKETHFFFSFLPPFSPFSFCSFVFHTVPLVRLLHVILHSECL